MQCCAKCLMRLTTVQDNNMQQHATMIHKCCVLLGKKFGSFDRGFSVQTWHDLVAVETGENKIQDCVIRIAGTSFTIEERKGSW